MKESKPHPTPDRRHSPGILWALLLPLALLVGGLIEAYRQPASPLVPVALPSAGPRHPVAPAAIAPRQVQASIYVPDPDATLQKVRVPLMLPDPDSPQARVAAAVPLLLRAAPEYFPPGAALAGPVKLVGDVAELNFNAQFAAPTFWEGSTRTTTAIYAIVNTVVANANPKAVVATRRVRFLVEGQPVEVLGEFDTTDPVPPKPGMVARG